jgi:CheY-like chemotaxis protein
MHGDISIHSQPGKGSDIRFTAQFEHSHIGAQTLHEENRYWVQLYTLVVDDNAIARDIIASTARLIHLKVETADGAVTALERIRAAAAAGTPYQLVLMDYKMPDINGLEATAMIKSDASLTDKPQVILVSSYHRDEILLDQSNAELVEGFISKPVSESRLFDAISSVFGKDTQGDDASPDNVQLLSGISVLVAEDNHVNQQVVSGILRKRGIKVTLASNGREAVEKFNACPTGFDVILMDVEMPEMNGFEATEVIRKGSHFPQTPIVAVTAQAMRGDREQCINTGMNGYISKPIKPALLYSSLLEILGSKSLANKSLSNK